MGVTTLLNVRIKESHYRIQKLFSVCYESLFDKIRPVNMLYLLSHLNVEVQKILAHPPTPRLIHSYYAWNGSQEFHDTSLCLCC